MKWIIFDDEARDNLADWNEETIYQVEPRLADAEGPHESEWLAPERVLHGVGYADYWPDKIGHLPVIKADPDDLFLPSEV